MGFKSRFSAGALSQVPDLPLLSAQLHSGIQSAVDR